MNDLIPVDFHGHKLITVRLPGEVNRSRNDNGCQRIHVAIRPICEALGLDWSGQFRRLKRDPVLERRVAMMATRLPGDPRTREVIFLDIDYLNGWLFGIDANRVKPELRDMVIRYQDECYRVLARHFRQDANYELAIQGRELRQMKAAYFERHPRDEEILRKVCYGMPYKLVAKDVKCHPSTVGNAVKRMLRWGLISLDALMRAHQSARIFARSLRDSAKKRQMALDF